MWKPSVFFRISDHALLQTNRCLCCQLRSARIQIQSRSSVRYFALKSGKKPSESVATTAPSQQPSTKFQFKQNVSPSQPGSNPGDEDFIPPALDRPIGLAFPPQEGQNTGIDARTIRERRDDFVNYDKHLERRKELTRQVAKPYFRDWSNMRYHQGKTFMSNLRLFKRDKAQYFPNMYGITLASPKQPQNTTTILRGKVSVVNVFSSVWAEGQVATFTGPEQNPKLQKLLKSNRPLVQRIDINLEENALKAALVRMFMWRMRAKLPTEQHERYFLVRKGMTDGLKHAIGMMNSKVGYVFLLDENCRIRWAGSGPAEPMEIEALNHGLVKLIASRKTSLESNMPADSWSSTEDAGWSATAKPKVVMTS